MIFHHDTIAHDAVGDLVNYWYCYQLTRELFGIIYRKDDDVIAGAAIYQRPYTLFMLPSFSGHIDCVISDPSAY
jgi:hypothetical protein